MSAAPTTSRELSGRLDELFSGDPAAIAESNAIYRELRNAGRAFVYRDFVLFTEYDDVHLMLRDAERFLNKKSESSNRGQAFQASLAPDHATAFDYVYSIEGRWLTRLDGDVHARTRAVAHRFFTPRRIAALADAAERYVQRMLDELRDQGEGDWMELAYMVPLLVVCDLLGAPHEDLARIYGWSRRITANFGAYDVEHLLDARQVYEEFEAYVEGLIETQRRSSGEGSLVSALIEARDHERLSAQDVTGMFIVILLAGHETTSNLIGTGLHELLLARDQWQRLADDPALAPKAVEELLRLVSPVQWQFRQVAYDTEVAGQRLEAGQDVGLSVSEANRDPRVFADPDSVDITRPEIGQHLAFGFGPHFCLGAALARLEAQTAFAALARRFPDVELVTDAPTWHGGGMTNVILRRIEQLYVRLGDERTT